MSQTGQETIVVTGTMTEIGFMAEKKKQLDSLQQKLTKEGKEIVNIVESMPTSILGFKTQEIRVIWKLPEKPAHSTYEQAPVIQKPTNRKSAPKKSKTYNHKENINVSSENFNAIVERIYMFLEDGEWDRADYYCEQALNYNPKSSDLYLAKLMAELKVKSKDKLKDAKKPFDKLDNAVKAIRFDPSLEEKFKLDNECILERIETDKAQAKYDKAVKALSEADSEIAFKKAAAAFKKLSGFKDADVLAEQCLEKAVSTKRTLEKVIAAFKLLNGESEPTIEDELNIAKTKIARLEDSLSNFDALFAQATQFKEELLSIEKQERELIEEKSKQGLLAFRNKKRIDDALTVLNAEKKNIREKIGINNQQLLGYVSKEDIQKEINNEKKVVSKLKAKIKRKGNTDNSAYSYGEAFKVYLRDKNVRKEVNSILYPKVSKPWTVMFGRYIQDETNIPKPIEWTLLREDNKQYMLISKYALDCEKYNYNKEVVTWETCSLRKWLNDTFYNKAFLSEEKALMINTDYHSDITNKTDRVFILTDDDYKNMFYRDECYPTKYAIRKGAIIKKDDEYRLGGNGNGTCYWWVCPSTKESDNAGIASYNSHGHAGSNYVNYKGISVRPVIYIQK